MSRDGQSSGDQEVRVGVLGAGLIGNERLKALDRLARAGRRCTCVGLVDPVPGPLAETSARFGVPAFGSLDELLKAKPDWVVVATPHNVAGDLTIRALRAGCRVLIEKPPGRSSAEARRLLSEAGNPERLAVGFNYRFFAGLRALLGDARAGRFGRPVSVTMVLGHGGSPNDAATWRRDPVQAGGGCLLDPGIHLLDLVHCLADGPVHCHDGMIWRGFWYTGIEEECHLLLDAGGVPINLQVSVVRWRSSFRVEVHGTDGYGIVTGRGRSYGEQVYIRGERWGWQKAPSGRQSDSEELVARSDGDESFAAEMDALFFGPGDDGVRPCRADEAVVIMDLYEACLARLGLSYAGH
jgi:predicted dehydrogenase